MSKHVVAALQLGSDSRGKAATLEKILSYEEKIKASGADLVVLPEALLGSYPKGEIFGTYMGYRLDEGRDKFCDYFKNAITDDGPKAKLWPVCRLEPALRLLSAALNKLRMRSTVPRFSMIRKKALSESIAR